MSSLLIAVIYLAFISLGLPDSLLGAGWPDMYQQMQMPISAAGIITMLISCGTVISSLFSGIVARRLGTGVTVAVSTALTACGMFGFAFSTEFWMLCVLAFPYGLGAGAIDVALNNYVALHYSSRQMSWLHCFWGVGTIISPYIMSYALTGGLGWSSGYKIGGDRRRIQFHFQVDRKRRGVDLRHALAHYSCLDRGLCRNHPCPDGDFRRHPAAQTQSDHVP